MPPSVTSDIDLKTVWRGPSGDSTADSLLAEPLSSVMSLGLINWGVRFPLVVSGSLSVDCNIYVSISLANLGRASIFDLYSYSSVLSRLSS